MTSNDAELAAVHAEAEALRIERDDARRLAEKAASVDEIELRKQLFEVVCVLPVKMHKFMV